MGGERYAVSRKAGRLMSIVGRGPLAVCGGQEVCIRYSVYYFVPEESELE